MEIVTKYNTMIKSLKIKKREKFRKTNSSN